MTVRKDASGGRTVANLLTLDGVDYVGPVMAPLTSYTALLTPYDVDPATGVAFTLTRFNTKLAAGGAGAKITG